LTAITVEDARSAAAEFIATLLFVFLGAGTVVVTASLGTGELTVTRLIAIAFAHGLAIALLVSATGAISGGHINPVVTVAALVTGKIGVPRALVYIFAQLGGAIVGALLIMAVVPNDGGNLGAHSLASDVTVGAGLLTEIILTFALVFVVFATAIDPRGKAAIAPMAIGLMVLVGHLFAVPLTGASMNPARSFGPALVGNDWADHWIYWVGPVSGALLAAITYQYVYLRNIGRRP